MPYVSQDLLAEVITALENEYEGRDEERGERRSIEELRAAGLTALPDKLRKLLSVSEDEMKSQRIEGLARAKQLLLDISFERGYDEYQVDDAIEAIASAVYELTKLG